MGEMFMNVIIEYAVQIIAYLIVTLLGVLGAWLAAKFAKRQELTNISIATNEAVGAAQQTVLELQQTVVDGMKAAHEDGKLTEDEITKLSIMLVQKSMEKMSDPAIKVLKAAGTDITAVIKGAGEAMIQNMKMYNK